MLAGKLGLVAAGGLAAVGAAVYLTRRRCSSTATSTHVEGEEVIEVTEVCRTPLQRLGSWIFGAPGRGAAQLAHEETHEGFTAAGTPHASFSVVEEPHGGLMTVVHPRPLGRPSSFGLGVRA